MTLTTNASPKKIVYLLGAGATHAEIKCLDPDVVDEHRGLLIRHVSSRVIQVAKKLPAYKAGVETVTGTSGSMNIELLISLIENSKIFGWRDKTALLIKQVEIDIKRILTPKLTRRFFLHKALFEMHRHRRVAKRETLLGLISLNYDDIAGHAYEIVMERKPNYCLSLRDSRLSRNAKTIPLLQLHGSFGWRDRTIGQRKRPIEIIPIGSTKSYTHVPYGHIWIRALEILVECDCLRIVGCSLSANDVHLIDLLFKAHLQRKDPIEIEIIDGAKAGERIKENYGFFPNIKTISETADQTIPDVDPTNPFKTWLKYQGTAFLSETVAQKTKYLKKVLK